MKTSRLNSPVLTALLLAVVLPVLLPWTSSGATHPYEFEYVTLEHGLSQATVNCVIQDSFGFLWFGTQNGLNRFDGIAFKVFQPSGEVNSLSQGWIQCMLEEEPGVLWLGTWGRGLNRFDTLNHRFTHYLRSQGEGPGLTDNVITNLCLDTRGALWIGTQHGLNRLDRGADTFIHFRGNGEKPGSLNHDQVNTLYAGPDGSVWIGTLKGLNRWRYETGRFERFGRPGADTGGPGDKTVIGIAGAGDGHLWVGTYQNGLYRFNKKTHAYEHFKHQPGKPNSICGNAIGAIHKDEEGITWVGTGNINADGNGMSSLKRNGKTGAWDVTTYPVKSIDYSFIPSSPYLSDAKIFCIFQDRGGNLWYGTQNSGLIKLSKRKKKFRLFRNEPGNPNSLSDNGVFCLLEDSLGILWVGTFAGGLNRWDRKTGEFTHFRYDPANPRGIAANMVVTMTIDRGGRFWIGSGSGTLSRFFPGSGTFKHYEFFPTGTGGQKSVISLLEDRDGVFWIGTWTGGLFRMNRETGEFFRQPLVDGNESIIKPFEDSRGNLWFGTYSHGLVKATKPAGFDSQKDRGPIKLRFKEYSYSPGNKKGLRSNSILCMIEREPGWFWVGADQGLYDFEVERETFTRFSEEDGMANNLVYGIIPDGETLWLSTNGGISRFNTRTRVFRNYGVADGVQAREFSQGAYYRTREGEIFFGGVNGLNAFFPGRVTHNPNPPPVVVTGFSKYDKPVTFSRAVYAVDEIKLSYGDRFFSIQYAALDFENSGNNRYAYKLENFNSDWIQCGNRRIAGFTNLDGGTYIFRVKGSNNDGVWNEVGASLRIVVTPPPWQTWWFRTLVFLLISAFLLLLHKRRTGNLKEKLEKMRLEKELELKTDFTAMLVHDLRTPLQCIDGYTELLEVEKNPSAIKRFTGHIKLSTGTMLRLINDMLDMSKFEAGKMELRREHTELPELVRRNVDLIAPLVERRNIRFQLDLEPLPAIIADPVRLSQVLNNLISNAVKFSPENSVITVTARTVDEAGQGFQEIAVADRGPGIEPEKREALFLKYTQLPERSQANGKMLRRGTGLGLAVSRLIIEAHGGTIGFRPVSPTGSIFYFRLPTP